MWSITYLQGYSRLGAALLQLDRLREAEQAYNHGLRLDPGNRDMEASLERTQKKQGTIFPKSLVVIKA